MTGPQADTTDLRTGPPVHDDLLALLPLVGVWAGVGSGTKPATGESFRYVQQVVFAHDGRPFLAYESQTWLIDDAGDVIRAAARETGFWRPGAGPDDVEVALALNTGLVLALVGTAGDQQWDLRSQDVVSLPGAKQVDANRRFYAVVVGEAGTELAYAHEVALPGRPALPHLNARLSRVNPTGT